MIDYQYIRPLKLHILIFKQINALHYVIYVI